MTGCKELLRVITVMLPVALFVGLLLTGCETDNTTPRTRLPYIDEQAPPSPQIVTPVPPAQTDRHGDSMKNQPKETTK